MKKELIRKFNLKERETSERLMERFSGSDGVTIMFKDCVVVAGYHYNNEDYYRCWFGAVYGFMTEGPHDCEDELELVDVSDRMFEYDGDAISWGMSINAEMVIARVDRKIEEERPKAKMNNVRYCGNKEQDRMVANGWHIALQETIHETTDEMFERLSKSWDKVKIYYEATRVRGIHSYFAMVK